MWKPTRLPRGGRRGVPRGDGRQPDRRGADPRRLPAQLRQRGPRHPRANRCLADPLAARRARRSAPRGVVLHPGSAKTGDVGEAIARAGETIREALAESEGCQLHLENTAGAGGTLGRSLRGARRAARGRRRRASASACAWTPATCSPPAMTSARRRAWTRCCASATRRLGRERRRLAAPQRLADAAGLQPRPPRQHRRGRARRGRLRRVPVRARLQRPAVRARDTRARTAKGPDARGSRAGVRAARARASRRARSGAERGARRLQPAARGAGAAGTPSACSSSARSVGVWLHAVGLAQAHPARAGLVSMSSTHLGRARGTPRSPA